MISISLIETPLEQMYACATEQGICLLEFVDKRTLEYELKLLNKYLRAEIVQSTNVHLDLLKIELAEYFAGKRKQFSVPIHMIGTDFQQKAWIELLNIPYGCTRSYIQQAKAIKNPKAVRAIGRANGRNRLPIVIPCHRVIGSNGELVGYGSGVERKLWLLEFEKTHS